MICGVKSGDNCSSVSLDPLSYPPDDLKSELVVHCSALGNMLPWQKNGNFLSCVRYSIFISVSFSSAQPQQGMARSHRIAIICGATAGPVAFVCIAVGMLLWWRHRRNQQIFFDVNGNILFDSVLMRSYQHHLDFDCNKLMSSLSQWLNNLSFLDI